MLHLILSDNKNKTLVRKKIGPLKVDFLGFIQKNRLRWRESLSANVFKQAQNLCIAAHFKLMHVVFIQRPKGAKMCQWGQGLSVSNVVKWVRRG
jgi:hypothetical protein